jgi:hypothetical protein
LPSKTALKSSPRFLAVEMAIRSGGKDWVKELKVMLSSTEAINF